MSRTILRDECEMVLSASLFYSA